MTEHADERHAGHSGLADVREALAAAYSEILTDPRYQTEGLDRAACGPHVKHLAELAAATATAGDSAARWRTDMLTTAGPTAARALDEAETCMRRTGLWPWSS